MAVNRGIDEELFAKLTKNIYNRPFHKMLGMELLEVGPGNVSILMRAEDKLLNHLSILHGGAIASLCDVAMGMAVMSLGIVSATVEMKVNYLAPGKKGRDIVAKGKVIKKGDTLIVAEAELVSEGKLIVKSTGTYYKLNGSVSKVTGDN